jgi:hypothetical protein
LYTYFKDIHHAHPTLFNLHRTLLIFLLVVTLFVMMGIATLTNSPSYAVSNNPLYEADGVTFAPGTTVDAQGYVAQPYENGAMGIALIRPETIGTMDMDTP